MSSEQSTTTTVSRRSALSLGLSLAAAGALSSCSSRNTPTSGGTGESVPWPTYVKPPIFDGAVVSEEPGVPIGYAHLPKTLAKSVDDVPGRGSTIRHFQVTWSPPATPFDRNPWWQGLNERMNIKFEVTEVPASNYDAKFATTIAGGDLPEVIQLLNTAGSIRAAKQGAFADLTEILSADNILKYKNLANVRTDQWKAIAINGRIYGVPIDIPSELLEYRYRKDWAENLGFPKDPADADEMAAMLTAMTKGKPEGAQQTWGVTAFPGHIDGIARAMFQVPNEWCYADGKLVNAIETPQFEASLEWLANLWKAGAFHPDALALEGQTDRYRAFVTQGQVGIAADSAQNFYNVSAPYKKAVDESRGGLVAFIPPGHDGKVKATFLRSSGAYGMNAISAEVAKDQDRLDEILRCFNYRRAPFATQEWYYQRFGAPGDYFDRNAEGDPVPIANRNLGADVGSIGYGLNPQAWLFPNVKECVANNEIMVQQAVADPTQGLQSDTRDTKQAQLGQLAETYINQIVVGSRPASDLGVYRDAWRSRGGDAIRAELEQQLTGR